MPWQTEDICITALGMATPLAPNLRDSCAAFRAGITRISELDTVSSDFDESLGEEPIAACRAAYLAEGYCSGAKAVLLGRLALSDLLHGRVLAQDDGARAGIVLHLSDCFLLDAVSEWLEDEEEGGMPSTTWKKECKTLVPRMLTGSDLRISEEDTHVSFGAHAGFVDALQLAGGLLASGRLDRCLVGAVDSNLDPESLIASAIKGLLKTPLNPVGFIPGEAAAFALVERTKDPRRTLRPLAHFLCGPVVPGKFGRFSEEPPHGDALTQAIRDLLATGPYDGEVDLVIGDLNGDEYRASNWGSALMRLGNRQGVASAPMWIPALSFGETGAATGAVGLCLAVRAMELGYMYSGSVMAWLSDDSGSAAAMLIIPGAGGAER